MKILKKYDEFLILKDIENYTNDEVDILEKIIIGNIDNLNESIKLELYENWESLNEGIIDNIKNKANNFRQKVIKMSDKLSDDAKTAWSTIMKHSKIAIDMIKKVSNIIKEKMVNLKKMATSKFSESLISNDKFKEKLDKIPAKNITSELKNIKDVFKYINDTLFTDIFNSIKSSLIGFFVKKGTITESISNIKEKGVELFKKLIGVLDKIPPFKQLHELAHLIEKGLTVVIKKLNEIIKYFGGPELVIPVLIGVASIGFEYIIKHHAADMTLHLLPGFTVISGIAGIATILAVIHTIDKIFDGKVLDSHH